jgi:hypothetical protein
MKKRGCSKFYPKEFQEETTFTDTGFTVYRRRDTGIFIRRDAHNLDNTWVVPHNLELLKKYQAHINVEYVNKSKILNYLCKYVNKGPDQAKIIFECTAAQRGFSPGPKGPLVPCCEPRLRFRD